MCYADNTVWSSLTELYTTKYIGATDVGFVLGLEADTFLVGMEDIHLLPIGYPESVSIVDNIEMNIHNWNFF